MHTCFQIRCMIVSLRSKAVWRLEDGRRGWLVALTHTVNLTSVLLTSVLFRRVYPFPERTSHAVRPSLR
jgi:hypothetical protein